jgi:hypothetical protein
MAYPGGATKKYTAITKPTASVKQVSQMSATRAVAMTAGWKKA